MNFGAILGWFAAEQMQAAIFLKKLSMNRRETSSKD